MAADPCLVIEAEGDDGAASGGDTERRVAGQRGGSPPREGRQNQRRPRMPAPRRTPAAASTTWMSSSIQSMPIRMVSQIRMFCLPGTTRRPSAPMIRPTMIAVMMPELPHQLLEK
jgi:hypothetical protein